MTNLAEELFLVTLHETKGTAPTAGILQYGMTGAVLAELLLSGHISLEGKKVSVLQTRPLEDDILNAVLARLAGSLRTRKVTHWVSALNRKSFRKQVPQGLIDKGILQREKKHVFWIIPFDTYPQQDASRKHQIKNGLRDIVLTNAPAERRQIILLSLLKACHLLNRVYTKDERKLAARRIDELAQDDEVVKVLVRAIRDIEAAAASSAAAAGS